MFFEKIKISTYVKRWDWYLVGEAGAGRTALAGLGGVEAGVKLEQEVEHGPSRLGGQSEGSTLNIWNIFTSVYWSLPRKQINPNPTQKTQEQWAKQLAKPLKIQIKIREKTFLQFQNLMFTFLTWVGLSVNHNGTQPIILVSLAWISDSRQDSYWLFSKQVSSLSLSLISVNIHPWE